MRKNSIRFVVCSSLWIAVTETTLVINHSRNKNINETWTSVQCGVTNTDAGYSVDYYNLSTNMTVKATITAKKPPGATSYPVISFSPLIKQGWR